MRHARSFLSVFVLAGCGKLGSHATITDAGPDAHVAVAATAPSESAATAASPAPLYVVFANPAKQHLAFERTGTALHAILDTGARLELAEGLHPDEAHRKLGRNHRDLSLRRKRIRSPARRNIPRRR